MPGSISLRRCVVVLVTTLAFATGAARPAIAGRTAAQQSDRIAVKDRLLAIFSKKARVKLERKRLGIEQRALQDPDETKLTAGDIKRQLMSLELKTKQTTGEKIADKVSQFTGSWGYLGGGMALIAGWVYSHATGHPIIGVDEFNLGLSVLTWAGTPLIMKSASRQAKLDKRRQELFLQYLELTEEESRHADENVNEVNAKLTQALDTIKNYELKLNSNELKLDQVLELLKDKSGKDAAKQ